MAASLRMHTVTSPQVLRLLERQRSKTQYQKDLARFAPGGRGLTPRPFPDMEAARHGLLYEKEAITRFEQITGIPVLDVGHVIHERFEWLSCVPDGITVDGRVAEIKCPYYRPIVPGVPYQYIKQLQIAMEVTDLDEAILVQYKPASVFGEPIDPKVLKALNFSFGKALTEEEFKAQQAKGGARVAKSLDLRDIMRKGDSSRT